MPSSRLLQADDAVFCYKQNSNWNIHLQKWFPETELTCSTTCDLSNEKSLLPFQNEVWSNTPQAISNSHGVSNICWQLEPATSQSNTFAKVCHLGSTRTASHRTTIQYISFRTWISVVIALRKILETKIWKQFCEICEDVWSLMASFTDIHIFKEKNQLVHGRD